MRFPFNYAQIAYINKRSIGMLHIVVALLVSSVSGCFAASLDDYIQRYGAKGLKADYIIVVDVSGSMKEPLSADRPNYSKFQGVKDALKLFLEQIDPGEYVSFVGFGKYAVDMSLPREMPSDPVRRSALLAEVAAWKIPSGEIASYTNIGQALAKTVEETNRPNHSSLQFIFFLTDGLHTPKSNTAYADESSREWVNLAKKAKHEFEGRNLKVFALGLGEQTDVELVRRVFPDASIVSGDKEALKGFFARRKLEILRAKVGVMIANELRSAVFTPQPQSLSVRVWRGSSTTVPIVIKTNISHLDAEWTEKSLTHDWELALEPKMNSDYGYIDPQKTYIKPEVRFTSREKHSFWGALMNPFPHGSTTTGTLRLSLRLSAEPEPLMREMDINGVIEQRVDIPVELEEIDGFRPSEWGVVLLFACLLAWFLLRTTVWLRSGQLRGSIITVDVPREAENGHWDLQQFGKKATIGSHPDCEICLRDSSISDTECVLVADPKPLLKVLFSIAKPESDMYVLGDAATSLTIRRYPEQVIPGIGTRIPLEEQDELDFTTWRLRWNS